MTSPARPIAFFCLSLLLLAPAAGLARQDEHEMPSLTLADLAKGALRLDGLGSYHREITTAVPEAQAFFDQGLRLLFAFNHDEAARSFARATELDPGCAVCFWGVSFALGPNYNMILLPDRAQAAWDAAQKAQTLAEKASPAEKALIAAIQRRYKKPDPLDASSLQPDNEAFAAAMRDAAGRFPDDADLQTFLAESLMDLNPWKLWTNDGKPAPGTEEIVALLEKVLAKHPDHPGANHYYVHAIEASKDPGRAAASADRLRGMMPGAGHLVHMPAHIYQRIGRYAEASEANRKGAAADEAYVAKAKPTGYYAPMYYSHNHAFLAYSAAMEGRSGESVEAADAAARVALESPEMIEMMPGMDFFLSFPLLAKVRFGRWDDLLDDAPPRSDWKVLNGLWRFGRGMALSGKGQPDAAEAEWRILSQIAAQVPPDLPAGYNTARDLLGLAARLLEGDIAWKRGTMDTALAAFEDAVQREDNLNYDEPSDWFYPARHHLGAALLAAGRPAEAETIFRADLQRNPANGWALTGLEQALAAQKKDAAAVKADREKAWARADVKIAGAVF
jgi:tetratricopeptide (TPR) repeat protein